MKKEQGSGYLTISSAAKLLGVSRQALYDRIKRGDEEILKYLVKDVRTNNPGKKTACLYLKSEYVDAAHCSSKEISPELLVEFIDVYYDLWGCFERYLLSRGIVSRDKKTGKIPDEDLDFIETVIIGETIRAGGLKGVEEKVMVSAIKNVEHHSEVYAKKNISIFKKLLEKCQQNLIEVPGDENKGKDDEEGSDSDAKA